MIELIAAAVIVVGGALFTALSLLTRPAPAGPAASVLPSPDATVTARSTRRSIALMLAGLSGGAAVIHLIAAPAHYVELGEIASGFVAAAMFQAAWIRWCLAGPSRRTIVVGIVGNVAIVLAWLYTRTIGLPIGPFAGSPEPIGYPDGASVAFELILVAGLGGCWFRLDAILARSQGVRTAAAIAVVPVLGLVLVVTSLATVAVASGLDHGSIAGPAVHVASHP